MSLDVSLYDEVTREVEVFEANVTHNLGKMAEAAGVYTIIWRPEEVNAKVAGDLVITLRNGLELLKSEPERFIALEPSNKWGTYEGFVNFVEEYLKACKANPNAKVKTWR